MSYGQAESQEKGGTGMEGWTPPAMEGSVSAAGPAVPWQDGGLGPGAACRPALPLVRILTRCKGGSSSMLAGQLAGLCLS